MKMTINFHGFQRAFEDADRSSNFSYEGLRALFNYLEELEQASEVEIELDVIALCCSYQEIEDDEEAYTNYVGKDATLEDCILVKLPSSVLIREG